MTQNFLNLHVFNSPCYMSSILVKSVSAVMALSIAVPSFAAESWYERHAEGWHWYNDPEKIRVIGFNG